MKLDLTHDMYLPDPPRKRSRPTPARERNIDTFADPHGTREQREAWMRSRQEKPRDKLSFARFLSIGEYAIAHTFAQLEGREDLTEQEQTLLQVCRDAVKGYKKR